MNITMFEVFLKLLTTTNRIRHRIIKPQSSLHYSFYILEKLVLSKFNQDRYYFSKIIGMRIIFVSSIDQRTYEHYIKKPMPMGESKLNQIIFRNTNLINYSNRKICHPITKKYSNFPLTYLYSSNFKLSFTKNEH